MTCMHDIFVVVDMQYPFVNVDFDKDKIDSVAAAARSARLRNDYIFLIEDGHGHSTHEVITGELMGYDKTFLLHKAQWDGSGQIKAEVERLNLRPGKFTVCGAFAEQCVIATIIGLRQWYPGTPINVPRNACCPAPTHRYNDAAWQSVGTRLSLVLS